jgi:hypothetical protein
MSQDGSVVNGNNRGRRNLVSRKCGYPALLVGSNRTCAKEISIRAGDLKAVSSRTGVLPLVAGRSPG